MNIGDLMSDAGVSWAYYGGGWDNAAGNVERSRLTGRTARPAETARPDRLRPTATATANAGIRTAPTSRTRPTTSRSHTSPATHPDSRIAPHLQDEQDFLSAAAATGSCPR